MTKPFTSNLLFFKTIRWRSHGDSNPGIHRERVLTPVFQLIEFVDKSQEAFKTTHQSKCFNVHQSSSKYSEFGKSRPLKAPRNQFLFGIKHPQYAGISEHHSQATNCILYIKPKCNLLPFKSNTSFFQTSNEVPKTETSLRGSMDLAVPARAPGEKWQTCPGWLLLNRYGEPGPRNSIRSYCKNLPEVSASLRGVCSRGAKGSKSLFQTVRRSDLRNSQFMNQESKVGCGGSSRERRRVVDRWLVLPTDREPTALATSRTAGNPARTLLIS